MLKRVIGMLKRVIALLCIIVVICSVSLVGYGESSDEYIITQTDVGGEFPKELTLLKGETVQLHVANAGSDEIPLEYIGITVNREDSSEPGYVKVYSQRKTNGNTKSVYFYVKGLNPGKSTVTITYTTWVNYADGASDTKSYTCEVTVKDLEPVQVMANVEDNTGYPVSQIDLTDGNRADLRDGLLWSLISVIEIPFYNIIKRTAYEIYDDGRSGVPIWKPNPIRLHVTLTNMNPVDIYDVEVKVYSDKFFFSLRDIAQVGQHTKTEVVPLIRADGTVHLFFDVYPTIVYKQDDIEQMKYSDDIKVECAYKHPEFGNSYCSSDTTNDIHVESNLRTPEKYEDRAYDLDFASIYDGENWVYSFFYNILHGGSGTKLGVYCPVNLLVYTSDGTLLGVIETDDEEIIETDDLYAYADGDSKHVYISDEALGDYDIQIEAVEDGTMTVLSVDNNDDGSLAMSLYQDVPIASGDVFSMEAGEEETTRLYRQSGGEEIAADYVFNRSEIAKILREAGIGDAYLDAAVEAVVRGIVPGGIMSDFQKPATHNDVAECVLTFMECVQGLPIGYYTDEYIVRFAIEDESAVTPKDVVTWLGIGAAYRYNGDPDSELARLDAAYMIYMMLGVMEIPIDFEAVEWSDMKGIPDDYAVCADLIGDAGAFVFAEEGSFDPREPITREEVIYAFYMIWEYIY